MQNLSPNDIAKSDIKAGSLMADILISLQALRALKFKLVLPMSVATVPRPFLPPVLDCLQQANTEGEAWEIWLCVVHHVDTQQVIPNKECQSLSDTISLCDGGQSTSKAASISSVVHNAR